MDNEMAKQGLDRMSDFLRITKQTNSRVKTRIQALSTRPVLVPLQHSFSMSQASGCGIMWIN